jgi:hypothetical protein
MIHSSIIIVYVYDIVHRGQANFSACPVWMHTQSNITYKHHIHLST